MTIEILTPDKTVYEGEAVSVNLPGALGFFEILNNHAPIISTLEDGKVIVRHGPNIKEDVYFIKGGVVEASHNKVVVLAEGITQK
ncbi:MAG TPA: ATP synthase F1 subunit epsilon [Mucilaginibacter sp.]|jgi:F-type H+-transporting ATPase subunit epsilon|nr:ATP synthase F1 subunit epsilon [Mucilaginibacter sp.]